MIDAGLFTTEGGAIPLRGVEVTGEVLGGHARVTVRQRYQNTEAKPVEAVYTFPLPSDASLSGFSMTCDGRRIEGQVKEREEAFQAYDDALVAGHGAALLEQERPNVFTANVGNLLPKEETLIEVEYLQRVQADEGALRWMVPTLVAPRYIPGVAAGNRTGHGWAGPTDRVPDADRITPKIGQVDYGLKLDLVFDLGRSIVVESPSHAVKVQNEDDGRVRVSFQQGEVALDRDVVLNIRGITAETFTTVAAHREAGKTGAVALTVVPDLAVESSGPVRQDVVFLIDVSGSMAGASITEARSALKLCLRHLREGDRFNVIAFNHQHFGFQPALVPFTQHTLSMADGWVQGLAATGGTELLSPVLEAVRAVPDGVVVLLTDGQVGNEDEILRETLAVRGRARFYSFGIGTNVSDVLLRELGRQTGGAVEFVHPGERIDEKVVAQFARAIAPRVTGITAKFDGIDVAELAPGELPPLIDGEPWVLPGRYDNPGIGRLELRGTLGGQPWALTVPIDLPDAADRPAVLKLWATERIRDLDAMEVVGRRAQAMKDRIVKLAVEHGVSSRYTSFVVVEKRTGERRASSMPETRVVPVNAPAGWAMFQGQADAKTKTARRREGAVAAGRMQAGMPMPAAMGGGFSPHTTGSFQVPGGMPAPPPMSPPSMPPPAPMMASAEAQMPMVNRPSMAPMREKREDSADFEVAKKKVAPATPREASAAAPGRSLLQRAKDLLLGGSSGADSVQYEHRQVVDAAASVPNTGAAAATTGMPVANAGALAAGTATVEPVVALLSRQLASGLWDDASVGDEDLRQVRATARALHTLLAAGITTSHALYGAQVRKAIEALLKKVPAQAAQHPREVELALGVAWLAASGHRTRSQVESVARGASLLQDGFADEASLRKRVDQLVAG